jgi:hypothetical protein
VEGAISEKSKDLKTESKGSSWLVFKLKKHIHILKRQIDNKNKQIVDFGKNKYNEILNEKEVLFEIIQNEKKCL